MAGGFQLPFIQGAECNVGQYVEPDQLCANHDLDEAADNGDSDDSPDVFVIDICAGQRGWCIAVCLLLDEQAG